MNIAEYLKRELAAAMKRMGKNALETRSDLSHARKQIAEEGVRNDETDVALVELGGLSADNAMSTEEVMTAQVELAGMIDEALTRADEQDAALVEIAGMLAETLASN